MFGRPELLRASEGAALPSLWAVDSREPMPKGPSRWFPYAPPRDGWIVLIVDGSTAFDDEGTYTPRVRLGGCAAAGCECP